MATKKVAGNVIVTYNSNVLTAYLNSQSLAAVVNAIDVTDFSSTGTEAIAGLPTWTCEVGGHWDTTLDGYLGPNAVTPPTTLNNLQVDIDTVRFLWNANSFIGDYTVESTAPSDGITWSGTLTCSGTPTRSIP